MQDPKCQQSLLAYCPSLTTSGHHVKNFEHHGNVMATEPSHQAGLVPVKRKGERRWSVDGDKSRKGASLTIKKKSGYRLAVKWRTLKASDPLPRLSFTVSSPHAKRRDGYVSAPSPSSFLTWPSTWRVVRGSVDAVRSWAPQVTDIWWRGGIRCRRRRGSRIRIAGRRGLPLDWCIWNWRGNISQRDLERSLSSDSRLVTVRSVRWTPRTHLKAKAETFPQISGIILSIIRQESGQPF